MKGADIPAGLVEQLIPKRVGKWKSLVDYGIAKDFSSRKVYELLLEPRTRNCLISARSSRRRSSNAVGYAKFYSRSHDVVIRVLDYAGRVIETHEEAGGFREP